MIYHNVEQNKSVRYADDVADAIVDDGFDGVAWLSDRPIDNGARSFTGIVVDVEDDDLTAYEVVGDAISDYGVTVYAVPAEVANAYPRERWYPREDDDLLVWLL